MKDNTTEIKAPDSLPWKYVEGKSFSVVVTGPIGENPHGVIICDTYAANTPKQDECMAYLVHAANNFPALVKELEQSIVSLAALTDGEVCDHAVGICWCGIKQEMDEAREVLKAAKDGA